MIRFIIDSDHLSLIERGHAALRAMLDLVAPEEIATSIVSAEEVLRGLLNLVKRADDRKRVIVYSRFRNLLHLLTRLRMVPFDDEAERVFESLRASRLRIGTQDLKIAAIALASNATLVTRNRADFERVPNLRVEDWSA